MQQKIYFNNKPLFLIDEKNKEIEELLHHEDTVFIDDFDFHTVKAMVHEMESSKIHAGVFLHKDVTVLLNAFKRKLTLVKAAGGLIYTDGKEILLIFRKGKWDLPKGKLDKGETLEYCAIREITEETGLKNIGLKKPLSITYHTYHEGGKHILKESHWYMIKGDRSEVLTPQVNEDIEKCEWVSVDKLAPYMENTHASIIDVVNAGVKELHQVKNV